MTAAFGRACWPTARPRVSRGRLARCSVAPSRRCVAPGSTI